MNKKVKLLIITQKVDKNDDILGFFHRWILEFAKHYEQITVIALQVGKYDLPKNVKVLSLGKEELAGKGLSSRNEVERGETLRKQAYVHKKRSFLEEKIFSKIKYTYRFYKYIYQERKNYDAVFVHMNPIYVVLGGVFWCMWRKKISLWYAHGGISVSLRIAEKLSDIIITSTASGFRLKSKKVYVVGQGIDIEKFKQVNNINKNNIFRIISIGRISPVKKYETLIHAIEILAKDNIQVFVEIIGGAGLKEQEKYFSSLKKMVKEKGLEEIIVFKGSMPYKDILEYLQQSSLFVNTSHTGSLDKVVLEAMAVGLPVLTCNEALIGVLGGLKDKLMFTKEDSKELAEKIKSIINMDNSDRINLGQNLRRIVEESHNLNNFVNKISNIISKFTFYK